MREFFTDTNKRIAIYDDLFTLGERQKYYLFCINSNFKLGWGDGVKIEKQKYKFLHSNWSPSDLDASGILDKIKNTAVANLIRENDLHQIPSVIQM